jgi:hypothetical protein
MAQEPGTGMGGGGGSYTPAPKPPTYTPPAPSQPEEEDYGMPDWIKQAYEQMEAAARATQQAVSQMPWWSQAFTAPQPGVAYPGLGPGMQGVFSRLRNIDAGMAGRSMGSGLFGSPTNPFQVSSGIPRSSQPYVDWSRYMWSPQQYGPQRPNAGLSAGANIARGVPPYNGPAVWMPNPQTITDAFKPVQFYPTLPTPAGQGQGGYGWPYYGYGGGGWSYNAPKYEPPAWYESLKSWRI